MPFYVTVYFVGSTLITCDRPRAPVIIELAPRSRELFFPEAVT